MMEYLLAVPLARVPTLLAEGWRVCGCDPRYGPAFGTVTMCREITS